MTGLELSSAAASGEGDDASVTSSGVALQATAPINPITANAPASVARRPPFLRIIEYASVRLLQVRPPVQPPRLLSKRLVMASNGNDGALIAKEDAETKSKRHLAKEAPVTKAYSSPGDRHPATFVASVWRSIGVYVGQEGVAEARLGLPDEKDGGTSDVYKILSIRTHDVLVRTLRPIGGQQALQFAERRNASGADAYTP